MSAARILSASVLAAGVALAASLGLACDPNAGSAEGAGGGAARSAVTADKSGDCASCHMEEYEHVKNPPHVGAKPTTCGVCHVQDGWHPAVLRHDWWPLTGAHQGRPDTQCAWCHKGTPAMFRGTPKECASCHQEDYDASTFPDHQTFQKKCTDCHSTDAWKPAKHPPPKPPPPAPAVAPTSTAKATPKGTPPKTAPRTTPVATATVPQTPVPIPRPTSVPTTRPPDVISRPSRR